MAKLSKTKKRTSAPQAQAKSSPNAFSWTVVMQAAVIVAAALVIYGPALHGEWIWDDELLVTGNSRLRSADGLFKIWFSWPTNDYWPLTWTLLWVEWHLWGSDPFAYHLTSVVLHVCSGFLLWRLLGRLGLRWGWLGGLLFVIHPLMVESVAWVAEIKNTLSLPFFLLACDAWLDAEEGKPFAYGKSILFYLAAMLAKSSTVMLPAVLLLYCWWKRQTLTRRELLRMIPYAAIAAVLGLLTIFFQNPEYFRLAQHIAHPVDAGGPLSRAWRAGAAIFFYLGKVVLPIGLLPLYPRSMPDASWLSALTFPCLALLLVLAWLDRKSWGRHVLFGFGFFLITILPVAGLARMKYFEIAWVADHLAYLPPIGLIALTVAGLEKLAERIGPQARYDAAGILLPLVVALTWLSRDHASLFANSRALWVYTAQGNPDGYYPRNKLGYVLLQEHRFAESVQEYKSALRINPDDYEAYCNIGICCLETGHLDPAQAYFEKAIQAEPGNDNARANLGGVYMEKGLLPEAVAEFQAVLQNNPENTALRFELGTVLLQMGRAAEAVGQFTEIQWIDPNYPNIRESLAAAQQKAAAKP